MRYTKQHAELARLSRVLRHAANERANATTRDDLISLAASLERIASGADANVALGVKRGRGQSVSREQTRYRLNLAITWISAAIRDRQDDGFGITVETAKDRAAVLFQVNRETLEREWGRRTAAALKTPTFRFDTLLPA